MQEIREVGVMSMAKIQALIMGLFGLVFGIIYGLIFGMVLMMTGKMIGIIVMLMMMIFIPLAYAGIGFVMGAAGAWLYNVIARKIGGIKIDLKKC